MIDVIKNIEMIYDTNNKWYIIKFIIKNKCKAFLEYCEKGLNNIKPRQKGGAQDKLREFCHDYNITFYKSYSIKKLQDKIKEWFRQENNSNEKIIKEGDIAKSGYDTEPERTKVINYSDDKEDKLITSNEEWIKSFGYNNNTGVKYEKDVGSFLLKKENVREICNYTQKDDVAGTADIGIVYIDGKQETYSITKWIGKNKKCIRNPSGIVYYGLSKDKENEKKNNESYEMDLKYKKKHYGSEPNKEWKRKMCPFTINMCTFLAKKGSENWNSMTTDMRIKKLRFLLDLKNDNTPNADGIIFWNKSKNCIEKIYKWELNIDLDDYLNTYSDGIYIYHGTPGNIILKTQVKYNNGIIEGMSSKLDPENWVLKKSKNYLSSWNCVAQDLNKIFTMKEVTLDK